MKEKLRKIFKNAKTFKIAILLLFAVVFIFLGNSKIAVFIIGLMIGYFLVYGIENISNKLFEENISNKLFEENVSNKLFEENISNKLFEENVSNKLFEENISNKLFEENVSNKLFEENDQKVFEDGWNEMIKFRNDLETIKWLGHDEGWDLAINKIKESLDDILKKYHYKDFIK